MWVLLVLLLTQVSGFRHAPARLETRQPCLIVHVTDAAGPVSGAEVTVKRERSRRLKAKRAKTGEDGYVRFALPGNADYTVAMKRSGFRRARVEHVHIEAAGPSLAAHVQIRLRPAGSLVTVY